MGNKRMVIRTSQCNFGGEKIYPFKGSIVVRPDGKTHTVFNRKRRLLIESKDKPVKFRWTSIWRKNHKKGQEVLRQKTEKVVIQKGERDFRGLTMANFQKKKKVRAESELQNEPKVPEVKKKRSRRRMQH